jgi:ketosteroid isomerase-like protein
MPREGIMAAQEDADLARRGYGAFIVGDLEWLNDQLHEKVVWHVPGHNVTSGGYRGREDAPATSPRASR